PCLDASCMRRIVLSMVASTSRKTGAAWMAATRSLGWVLLGMQLSLRIGSGAMFDPRWWCVLPWSRRVVDRIAPARDAYHRCAKRSASGSDGRLCHGVAMSELLTTDTVAAQLRLQYWIDMICK